MPDLISTGYIFAATGIVWDDFNQFARPMVVVKEPAINVPVTGNSLYGYGLSDVSPESVTPESGVFRAKIEYAPRGFSRNNQVPVSISEDSIFIKVEPVAANYINNGKTKYVVLDGGTFRIVSAPIPVNYLGLVFYKYKVTIE